MYIRINQPLANILLYTIQGWARLGTNRTFVLNFKTI